MRTGLHSRAPRRVLLTYAAYQAAEIERGSSLRSAANFAPRMNRIIECSTAVESSEVSEVMEKLKSLPPSEAVEKNATDRQRKIELEISIYLFKYGQGAVVNHRKYS